MDKVFNWISLATACIGGWLAGFLGGFDLLLKTILILVVLDYATGLIKAIFTKTASSEVGFKGIVKKVLIFIMIGLAFAIQNLIGDAIPLREIVIIFYISNEGLSLLENVAEFIPIPEPLKNVLIQLRDKTSVKETVNNEKGE